MTNEVHFTMIYVLFGEQERFRSGLLVYTLHMRRITLV